MTFFTLFEQKRVIFNPDRDRKTLHQADNDGELLQDMGQQLLLTGKYGSAADFAKIIDAVKEEEV